MSECDEMLELISAALDGELTEEELTRLNHYLECCPDCAKLYQEFDAMGELLRVPREEAPECFATGVMERIKTEEQVSPPEKKKRNRFKRTAWIAAAAMFAVVIIGYGSEHLLMDGISNTAASTTSLSSADSAAQESVDADTNSDGMNGSETENSAAQDSGTVLDSQAVQDQTTPSNPVKSSSGLKQGAASKKSTTGSEKSSTTEATPTLRASPGTPTEASAQTGTDTQKDAASEEETVQNSLIESTSDSSKLGFAAVSGSNSQQFLAEQTWREKIELTGAVPELLNVYESVQQDNTWYFIVPAADLEQVVKQLESLGYQLTVTTTGDGIDPTAENGLVVVNEK
jgi:negative regulator of sigma E activity